MRKLSFTGIMLSCAAIISSCATPALSQYYRPIIKPGIRIISVINVPVGAQITSLNTQIQPAATERYYRATADRPGVWSKGSGGDAASYILDPTTGIYTINLAAAGDGSSQLVRTLPLIFTPTDGSGPVTQTITQTLTTVVQPSVTSESYNVDLSGSANTPLSSLPGWAISRIRSDPISVPVVNGNGEIVGRYVDGAGDGKWAVLYSPTNGIIGSKVTFGVTKQTDDKRIRFFFAASDYQNGVSVTAAPKSTGLDGLDGTAINQGGTYTDLGTINYVAYRADDSADIVFETSSDGNTLTVSFVGATTITKTIDLTGKTVGTKFGFAGKAAYAPAMEDGTLIKNISYIKPNVTLSVTDAPVFTANNVATYSLAWFGTKPTRLQQRLYDPITGNPVTNWMTGDSIVTGTTSGTISQTVTAPNVGNYQVRFRPLNDTAVVAIADSTTQFLANVEPFQAMYNVRSANYYQPVPPLINNWAVYSELRTDFNQLLIPYDGMSGYANVQTTPGTIWSSDDPTISVVSTNVGTGTLRLNVTDGTGQIGRKLKWTGTTPTQFVVTRDGQTSNISPEWVAAMEGEGLRDLDMTLGNSAPIEGSSFVRNTSSDKFYRNDYGVGPDEPFQNVIDGVAAKAAVTPSFNKYWTVFATDLTDAQVTERFTYMRDHLPTTMRIIVERGNEEWNNQFLSSLRTRLQGVREGWYGTATYSNPQPALSVAYSEGGDQNNTASPATPAGGYVMANYYDTTTGYGSGYVIWHAKQAVPAGTTIGPNAYWEIDTTKDPITAGKRFRSIRHNQIIEIARTVFGETRFQSQIFPVVMGQAGGGIYDQFEIERTFVPGYWAKVKGAGTAFYLQQGLAVDPATVTAAQLEASYRASLPAWKSSIRQVVADCLKMGKVPYFYEGMTHMDFAAYSNGSVPNYKTQHDALFAGDAGRMLMSDIAFFMKSNVPGVVTGYDLVGTIPWSLKFRGGDITDKRHVGWYEGLARTQ